ncbi:MAG: hypothetical protein HYX84_00435 [Chloroflexi bacterium]|nr:hypothetical protein [Chloroflexota bacterium]
MVRVAKRETKAQQGARKCLSQVPEEQVFWCHDGRVLRDVRELGEALMTMSDETFAYHSNPEKKDFSNWVRDVIGDDVLARRLGLAINKVEAANAVASRIAALNKKLA